MPWIIRMLMIVMLPVLTGYLYVGWRASQALRLVTNLSAAQSIVLPAAVALFLNLYPIALLASYLFGFEPLTRRLQAGHPITDAVLAYPFWVGMISVAHFVVLYLLMDAGRLTLVHLMQWDLQAWVRWESVVRVIGAVAVFLGVAFQCFVDTTRPRVITRVATVPGLPAAMDGLRLVHISDLQADPRSGERRLRRIVDRVNSLDADLILFSGDLVTAGTAHIKLGAQALGRMKARYGRLACLGDHDYWSAPRRITRELTEQGVTIREDECISLDLPGARASVAIITNVYSRRPRRQQIKQLLDHCADGVLRVVLVHQPDPGMISLAAERGIHLFLAGHTHGGQIVFKFLNWSISAPSMETPYVSGAYEVGNMLVNVCNGTGLTLAPIRFNAPAEITLLVLDSQSEN